MTSQQRHDHLSAIALEWMIERALDGDGLVDFDEAAIGIGRRFVRADEDATSNFGPAWCFGAESLARAAALFGGWGMLRFYDGPNRATVVALNFEDEDTREQFLTRLGALWRPTGCATSH